MPPMFRKLANWTGLTSGNEDKVRRLQAMGFPAQVARNALAATNGNVDQAAELLLSSGGGGGSGFGSTNYNRNNNNHAANRYATNRGSTSTTTTREEEALRNAMEESRQSEEQRQIRQAQEASFQATNRKNNNKSAASAAAGRAAMNRLSGKGKTSQRSVLAKHHPNVKVPAKLQDKSKEEQILRCVDRLKTHPEAIDTLLKALVALRDHPENEKFRNIDKSSAGYKKRLANVPGAEPLLLAMNFTPYGANSLVLHPSRVDPALLYLGISGLEGAKETKEYKQEKRQKDFLQQIKEIHHSADSSEVEALKRADLISKCPTEPSQGRGALMQVVLGDVTIRRRFDGDDVLQDVIYWIGGHGSIIPGKLMSREWSLVDMNRYSSPPIDCQVNSQKTLQYIGCWPSGKLAIRPSTDEWLQGIDGEPIKMSSSRGLGSAPSDTLR